jgi:hypothetical protein
MSSREQGRWERDDGRTLVLVRNTLMASKRDGSYLVVKPSCTLATAEEYAALWLRKARKLVGGRK